MKGLTKAHLLTAVVLAALFVVLASSGLEAAKSKGQSGKTGKTLASATQPRKLVIGLIETGSESDWRRAHTADIKAEAARRGINLRYVDAQQDQANQIKAIKNFIDQKVDAIILAPLTTDGWEPALKQAKKAGIPVILSDRGIRVSDDSLYVTLVGPNFVTEGRKAGEWLAKKTNGKCNIVELQGTIGSAPAQDRKKGFEEAISKFPKMKIIASQTGDFKRITGQQVMDAFIAPYGKQMEAVYAHNDDMALGAIQALENAGIKPGKDVIIVSVDAVKDAFSAMCQGKLNATVECSPMLGALLLDACERAVKGEKQPKVIFEETRVFDQSTAMQDIKTRRY